MDKRLVFTLVLVVPLVLTQNAKPAAVDMNAKIKGIAKGIVDKWIEEGLTITRDKVEGWIDTLDQANKGNKKNKQTQTTPAEINVAPTPAVENFGSDFNQVRDTLVDTFSNIGKVKCTNCKKDADPNHNHDNDRPTENKRLEQLSVEELLEKQETIKQLPDLQKMAQLAKVAGNLPDLAKLKDIANLAKTLQSLTTPREEL